MKNSFVELSARERATALLDNNSARELLGPLSMIMSPHLLPQDIVPQSDDGIVLMKGTISGKNAIVISMEGDFQGGGIGEVGGAKIVGALEKALRDNEAGNKVYPIIIFDTGGVRLQEANYGLLSISEIQNMIIALRRYVPVVGLVPGLVGSFGGMSITSAVTSYLIGTSLARVGLNGPEVIEQEAGVREFDSSDKALIWDTIGIRQKAKTGIVNEIVEDDLQSILASLNKAMATNDHILRSHRADFFLSLIDKIDFSKPMSPDDYAELYREHKETPFNVELAKESTSPQSQGRGYTWFSALTGIKNPQGNISTVLCADTHEDGTNYRYFTVVPDSNNKYPRVRQGEVGLQEGFVLSKYIRQAIEEDKDKPQKRTLVQIIDVPSQAYGHKEELMGIHVSLAASADAYAMARQAGHPVIGLIVGNAISGAFLAHGLQSNRLIALNDPQINVQAMSKESAARITLRTVEQLEKATEKVPAMAYDINNFNKLGALYALLDGINADAPTSADIAAMKGKVKEAVASLADDDVHFEFRYNSPNALSYGRVATRKVREQLDKEWSL